MREEGTFHEIVALIKAVTPSFSSMSSIYVRSRCNQFDQLAPVLFRLGPLPFQATHCFSVQIPHPLPLKKSENELYIVQTQKVPFGMYCI